MAFRSIGLAGLIVSALRSAVADPELQEQVDAQGASIEQVRDGMDGLTTQLTELKDQLASNESIDEEQRETLEGIVTELEGLATALTGPADDATDSGVIAEVEQIHEVEPSPAADAAVEEAGLDEPAPTE